MKKNGDTSPFALLYDASPDTTTTHWIPVIPYADSIKTYQGCSDFGKGNTSSTEVPIPS